ncbi:MULTISPECIES: SH3 domain-containing protein [Vibrio]|uniref:SH3 domain-containing protein n=1 Tax=Vibrio TaxID=662 RepID=UPI00015436B7|nr:MULTISPECIES: SH3 domain-containing protein [Vibrio]EDL69703.1 SH3 domain protein [Vibrio campbellii HY01]MCC8253797.1 SH3 domain-containing protein [Vibrio campbellii CAIM 333]MCE7730704.1 SH3 domain-containing protein [Vibrio campbellii]NDJ79851.1 SH3 domain-containing protein [Vibrio sp. LB10LO1]HDM8231463.1 SH3 domain-containing protein [Vibrio campbellii]
MKKALIALVILLLFGGAGAGYYFFFMQKEEPVAEQKQEPEKPNEPAEKPKPIMDLEAPAPEITEYYVIERRIDVYNKPEHQALVVDSLYKGEKVSVLEKVDGWFRLSDYIVYEEGGEETAEWVDSKGLSDAEPVIKEHERLEILDGYLQKSDDLKTHLDMFRNKTQQLLDDETCDPSDFEELGGWVRSVTYKTRNVYFIYCGGLEQENKIYLDVDKGEIFYR